MALLHTLHSAALPSSGLLVLLIVFQPVHEWLQLGLVACVELRWIHLDSRFNKGPVDNVEQKRLPRAC